MTAIIFLSQNKEDLIFQLQLTGEWSGDPYFLFVGEHYQVHKSLLSALTTRQLIYRRYV
ncbi:MAG: hypothetical protein H6Q52_571 [Deltaproteobacteria bacterium]|nr:hypothetical protein [Deltaproteobacteria bacterium]